MEIGSAELGRQPTVDRQARVRLFYRLSLALPLVVPVTIITCSRFFPPLPPAVGMVVAYIAISPFFGGIPYLVLAIWGLFWIDHRPEPEIRRRAAVVPVLMVLINGLQDAIWGVVFNSQYAMRIFLLGSGVILLLGYAYVVIVFGLRALLFGPITELPA